MLDQIKNAKLDNYSIVVMPDFFIDRILRLETFEQFTQVIYDKIRFGGGAIRGIPTHDVKGGNAVNIAYCLAELGTNVTLFTVADQIGSAILRQTFSKFEDHNSVDLRICNGRQGHTTALEFESRTGSKVNIMINDVGDIANFGPEKIDSAENVEILRSCNAVMVVNWGSNLRGTELIEYAFRNSPHAIHFIDPADIEERKYEFKNALSNVTNITDIILSINENECNLMLSTLGIILNSPSEERIENDGAREEMIKYSKKLSSDIKVKVNLHTRMGAAWSDGQKSEFAPSFKVQPRTLTGAGDAWNSANIVGHLLGLSQKDSLIMSNAYASLYVGNPQSEPPSMEELIEFMKIERIHT